MKADRFRLLSFTSGVMAAILLLSRVGYPHQVNLKPTERRQVSKAIGDFTLTDQNGQKFQFKNLRGKVVLVAFAYTTCPDVCPLLTAAMRQVQAGLSRGELERIYLLTITTDPDIDSPSVFNAYAKRYGAKLSSWSFLTGDEASLKPVWKVFGVGVKRKAKGLVDHTPLIAIVDGEGSLRVAYIGPAPDVKSVLQDLRALSSEKR